MFRVRVDTSSRIGVDLLPMIKTLSVREYKSFDYMKIELRPLTILLGKNSAGKSTVIELLNILKQTANQADTTRGPFIRLVGKSTNAGTPTKIFPRGQTHKIPEVEVMFDSAQLEGWLENSRSRGLREIASFLSRCYRERVSPRASRNIVSTTVDDTLDRLRRFLLQGSRERDPSYGFLGQTLAEVKEMFLIDPAFSQDIAAYFNLKSGEEAVSMCEELLTIIRALGEIDTHRASVCFALGLTSNAKLQPLRMKLSLGEAVILDIDLSDQRGAASSTIGSEAYTWKGFQKKYVRKDGNLFGTLMAVGGDMPLSGAKLVAELAIAVMSALRSEFSGDNIVHIGPLRPKPKRIYSNEEVSDFESAGYVPLESMTVDDLVTQRTKAWMEKMDVHLDVASEDDQAYRLLVLSEDKFLQDITDVGFGVSQVFPIAAHGFRAKPGTLIMLEEPEVHLHPEMQGELVSLFDEITSFTSKPAKSVVRDKCVLVETHSEYLLQKLAVTFARRRRGEIEGFNPKDVGVNYVSKIGDGSVLLEVPPPKSGTYQLPDGFATRQLELLMETI